MYNSKKRVKLEHNIEEIFVENVNDEQEQKREEYKTTSDLICDINSLPTEIFYEIFDRLNNPKDLLNVRLVNKRCKSMFDNCALLWHKYFDVSFNLNNENVNGTQLQTNLTHFYKFIHSNLHINKVKVCCDREYVLNESMYDNLSLKDDRKLAVFFENLNTKMTTCFKYLLINCNHLIIDKVLVPLQSPFYSNKPNNDIDSTTILPLNRLDKLELNCLTYNCQNETQPDFESFNPNIRFSLKLFLIGQFKLVNLTQFNLFNYIGPLQELHDVMKHLLNLKSLKLTRCQTNIISPYGCIKCNNNENICKRSVTELHLLYCSMDLIECFLGNDTLFDLSSIRCLTVVESNIYGYDKNLLCMQTCLLQRISSKLTNLEEITTNFNLDAIKFSKFLTNIQHKIKLKLTALSIKHSCYYQVDDENCFVLLKETVNEFVNSHVKTIDSKFICEYSISFKLYCKEEPLSLLKSIIYEISKYFTSIEVLNIYIRCSLGIHYYSLFNSGAYCVLSKSCIGSYRFEKLFELNDQKTTFNNFLINIYSAS